MHSYLQRSAPMCYLNRQHDARLYINKSLHVPMRRVHCFLVRITDHMNVTQ